MSSDQSIGDVGDENMYSSAQTSKHVVQTKQQGIFDNKGLELKQKQNMKSSEFLRNQQRVQSTKNQNQPGFGQLKGGYSQRQEFRSPDNGQVLKPTDYNKNNNILNSNLNMQNTQKRSIGQIKQDHSQTPTKKPSKNLEGTQYGNGTTGTGTSRIMKRVRAQQEKSFYEKGFQDGVSQAEFDGQSRTQVKPHSKANHGYSKNIEQKWAHGDMYGKGLSNMNPSHNRSKESSLSSKKGKNCMARLLEDAQKRQEKKMQLEKQKELMDMERESKELTFKPEVRKKKAKKEQARRTFGQFLEDQKNHEQVKNEKMIGLVQQEEEDVNFEFKASRKSKLMVKKKIQSDTNEQSLEVHERLHKKINMFAKVSKEADDKDQANKMNKSRFVSNDEQRVAMQRLYKPTTKEPRGPIQEEPSLMSNSAPQGKNQDRIVFKKLRKDTRDYLAEKYGIQEDEDEDPWSKELKKEDFIEMLSFMGFLNSEKASQNSLVNDMWKLDLKAEEDGLVVTKNILVLLGGIMDLKVPNIMIESKDENQNSTRSLMVQKGFLQFKENGRAYFASKKDIEYCHRKYIGLVNNRHTTKHAQKGVGPIYSFAPQLNKKTVQLAEKKNVNKGPNYSKLFEEAKEFNSRKSVKQKEIAYHSLDECTFFPMTNSKKERQKKQIQKQEIDYETKLFNMVMTQDEETVRQFKYERFLEQNSDKSKSRLNSQVNRSRFLGGESDAGDERSVRDGEKSFRQSMQNFSPAVNKSNLRASNLNYKVNYSNLHEGSFRGVPDMSMLEIQSRQGGVEDFERMSYMSLNSKLDNSTMHQKATNESPSKKMKPLVQIDVNLGKEKGKQKLVVYKGDDARVVAEKFAQVHQLAPNKAKQLEQLLSVKIQEHLAKTTQGESPDQDRNTDESRTSSQQRGMKVKVGGTLVQSNQA